MHPKLKINQPGVPLNLAIGNFPVDFPTNLQPENSMQTSFTPSAISDLEALANGKAMASQYERYVDRYIRQGNSFYTKILAKQGQKAAEAALAEWNRRSRISDFAAAVAPVVQGLLALSRANQDSVKVLDTDEKTLFPRYLEIANSNKMFVAFNTEPQHGCCVALPGAEDWGPSGRLGLKAVTLQAGLNREYEVVAELGLILPLRGEAAAQSKEGHVVVGIELTGYTRTFSFEPRLAKNGFLMYQLGMIGAERAVSYSRTSGGDFASAVGFPGAIDYVASALPKLGQYFTALAKGLGKAN
ncbi:MAG: hypothetical protein WC028_30805 [Candidatus Obscuribacterales bacterium]